MAGRILLSIIVLSLVGAACYAAGWRHREDLSIECRVIRVVTEETPNFRTLMDYRFRTLSQGEVSKSKHMFCRA